MAFNDWILFDDTFHRIMERLIKRDKNNDLNELYDWMKIIFEYNVPKGKRMRGLTVVKAFTIIAKDLNNNISETDIELARILGWTGEVLQAFALIMDDIMDQSIT